MKGSLKVCTALLLALGLSACTDQRQARVGGQAVVGPIPSDVCIQGGKPMILSVSVENEQDIDLAYVSKSGTLVVQKYGTGLGFTTKPQGKLIWTDVPVGNCSP